MSKLKHDEEHLDPKDLSPMEVQGWLTGGVAPRPIALVSTVSQEGIHNLSPFSFFNAFGANPPMVAFSPARRGRDGSLKDTYRNLMSTRECVIQAVTYEMVEQVNTSSGEYPPDVDEFVKSGLTPADSEVVQAKRVKESPFQMECKLHDMIHLGEDKGSGNLAICEVVKFHIRKDILTDGRIDPKKIDHVGRNGGSFYTRAIGEALFELPMPRGTLGVGYEVIPEKVRNSKILTANDLGKLANAPQIPSPNEARAYLEDLKQANPTKANNLELSIKEALSQGDTNLAWKFVLAASL